MLNIINSHHPKSSYYSFAMSVITQNLAFLRYWYWKKHLQMHF